MPFIQNVAYIDVKNGDHLPAGPEAVLIQITDHCMEPPKAKAVFAKTFAFEFSDIEEGDDYFDEMKITSEQAAAIAGILRQALAESRNVIVHCVAGLCRSGAVVEVGTILGFTDTNTYRQPNAYIKKMLMKEFGWTYDS